MERPILVKKFKGKGENLVTELYISSLSDYLSAIENLKTYYPTGMIMNNPTSTSFLYRGLADKDYQLLPGIFRKHISLLNNHEIVNDKYFVRTRKTL